MSRVVISSVPNFISLLQNYPALLQLSSFSALLPVLKGIAATTPDCGGCNKKKMQDNRSVFQSAMAVLQSEERAQMKAILNVREVCYYTLRDGKLDLHCF